MRPHIKPNVTSHAIIRFIERFGQTGSNTEMILTLYDQSVPLTERQAWEYGLRLREWETAELRATPYQGYVAVFLIRGNFIVSVLKTQPSGVERIG